MKRFKKIVALVLAATLVLSLDGVFASAVPALAAEESTDDLSDWLIGGGSAVSGNPTDGWQLVLGNGANYGSEVASYSNTAINLSKLQVNFDLSETTGGFMIGLGDTLSGFPAENVNVLNFYFTKNADSTWNVETYKGGVSFNKISNLGLTGTHAFGFIKTDSGWALSIDGRKVGKIDTDEDFGSNGAYEELINSVQAGQTRVTFVQFGDPVTIKNIRFTESANDLSGWLVGGNSTMSGNPTDGWQLALGNGANYGSEVASYSNPAIDLSKLQVNFELTDTNDGFMIGLGDALSGFPAENVDVLNFYFTKNADSTWNVETYKGGVSFNKISNLDLTGPHAFGFIKIGSGWALSIDGQQVGMIDTEEGFGTNGAYGELINNVQAGQERVTFVQFGAPVTIKNIHFTESTKDLTGWSLGNTTTMSGNSVEGWQIDFSGASELVNGTSYEAGMNVSKIQVKFNLSGLTGNMFFQLGNKKDTFYTGDNTRTNFVLEKIGSGLRIYGFDTNIEGTVFNSIDIENFEFEKDHVFEFVQNENGKWVPALDGVVRCFDQYIDYYDTFVKNMEEQSSRKTTVSFAPNNSQVSIKNINFTEKLLNGNTVTLDGNIGLNYYMDLGEALVNNEDAFMQFEVEGKIQKVPLSEGISDENGHKFTCKLPAKQMADEVKAQLFDGKRPVTQEYIFSVSGYAKGILEGESYTEQAKELVKNMLHYGAYAQSYFSYKTDKLANADLDELDLSAVTKETFENSLTQKGFNANAVGAADFGSIVASNLYLNAGTDLRVYIKLNDGIDKDAVTFTYDGKELEKGEYTSGGQNLITVTIPNIAAHELGNVFEINAEAGEENYTLNYSVFKYASNALGGSSTTGIKDLVKAMYKYYEAALAVSGSN